MQSNQKPNNRELCWRQIYFTAGALKKSVKHKSMAGFQRLRRQKTTLKPQSWVYGPVSGFLPWGGPTSDHPLAMWAVKCSTRETILKYRRRILYVNEDRARRRNHKNPPMFHTEKTGMRLRIDLIVVIIGNLTRSQKSQTLSKNIMDRLAK